jgi:hypothetical protein
MTALGFELAKPQQVLPTIRMFGQDVLAKVANTVESLAEGRPDSVDLGVLHSLNDLGEVFDRKLVKSIQWIVPGAPERKPISVVFDAKVRQRIAQRLAEHVKREVDVSGVVQMADFDVEHNRCRIHPLFGPPISCTFSDKAADQILAVMRKPAKVVGDGTINTRTGQIESVHIVSAEPLEPMAFGADFSVGYSFDELARRQGVGPVQDIAVFAGVWPDDEEPDDMVAEIYRLRH